MVTIVTVTIVTVTIVTVIVTAADPDAHPKHPSVFSFGLLATAIFANAGQVVLGTPAPHFLPILPKNPTFPTPSKSCFSPQNPQFSPRKFQIFPQKSPFFFPKQPFYPPKPPFLPKIPIFHPISPPPRRVLLRPAGHGHFPSGDPRPAFPARVPPQISFYPPNPSYLPPKNRHFFPQFAIFLSKNPKIPIFHPISPLPRRVLLRPAGHGIFANAGQVVLGTPAPHFLAVCRPNYSALGCGATPGGPPGPHRGPPDRFVPPGGSPCSGDPPAVAAARRDFPCKEAALGAYAGAFAGLYVTLAWRGGGQFLGYFWAVRDPGLAGWPGGVGVPAWPSPRPFLGFAAPPFLLGALRVAEHRNSWGGVLGASCAAPPSPPSWSRAWSETSRTRGGIWGGGDPPSPPRAAPPEPPTPPGGDQRQPGASGGVPSGDLRDPRNREPQKPGNPEN
ncbi:uncharacterized protein LOC134432985 [Melospiza melodia melodia]|uniref:uncharacterized protein LOC134432985 n=1 Tax=Melospiza melodia melodia TaxID=1914991 RepID=UPI002FD02197